MRATVPYHAWQWWSAVLGNSAAIAIIAFGLSGRPVLSLVLLLLVGAADMLSTVNRQSLIQFATPDDMRGPILDCGGGPASFTAEVTASGFRAVAVDPIYAFSGSQIAARFETVVEPMMAQIRATPGV